MKNNLSKMLIFVLIAFGMIYASDEISQPPDSDEIIEYQEYFKNLPDTLSHEEFEELRKRSEDLRKKNLDPNDHYFLQRKFIVLPFVLVFWFYLGLNYGLTNWTTAVITAIFVSMLPYIIMYNFAAGILWETLLYALAFSIGNVIFLRKVNTAHGVYL